MYILQCHCEMLALGARQCYLTSWGPAMTSVFPIQFDDELWALVEEWLVESRADDFVLSGSDLPEICKRIKAKCEEVAAQATKKIIRVNSVRNSRASG
jgi:hypothetical protein